MTIAIQTQSVRSTKFHFLDKLGYWIFAQFLRFWWHTQAYAVIFGVMLLTVISVVVLYLHDHLIKAFSLAYREVQQFPSQSPDIPTSRKHQF